MVSLVDVLFEWLGFMISLERERERSCVKAKKRREKEGIIILAFDIIRNFVVHRLIGWLLLLESLMRMMLSVVAITASAA